LEETRAFPSGRREENVNFLVLCMRSKLAERILREIT
jgi:hypothetical protein